MNSKTLTLKPRL